MHLAKVYPLMLTYWVNAYCNQEHSMIKKRQKWHNIGLMFLTIHKREEQFVVVRNIKFYSLHIWWAFQERKSKRFEIFYSTLTVDETQHFQQVKRVAEYEWYTPSTHARSVIYNNSWVMSKICAIALVTNEDAALFPVDDDYLWECASLCTRCLDGLAFCQQRRSIYFPDNVMRQNIERQALFQSKVPLFLWRENRKTAMIFFARRLKTELQ